MLITSHRNSRILLNSTALNHHTSTKPAERKGEGFIHICQLVFLEIIKERDLITVFSSAIEKKTSALEPMHTV